MSPSVAVIQRPSRCSSSRRSQASVRHETTQGDSHGQRSAGIDGHGSGIRGSSGRPVLMTWTAFVTIACLLTLGEVIQPVGGFAVVPSAQEDKINLANSEVADAVEQYLAPHDSGGMLRVRRKATSGGKPATCTCTCETALVSSATSSAAPSSGKSADEKNVKETLQLQQQHRGAPDEKISTSSANHYVHRQQQQQQSQLQQHQVASNPVANDDSAVSADEPSKLTAAASAGPSSTSLDYDEALGIFYGHGSDPNRSRDKLTAEQIINDIDSIDRYKGSWGHGSRHPWMRLPDRMCFREPCSADRDCCRRYNICDRSANVCTDCWYGNPCMSARDCCQKYPLCLRPTVATPLSTSPTGGAAEVVGKCVDI